MRTATGCCGRRAGRSGNATESLLHLSIAEKNELLFKRGVNFNTLPNWQKRGVGVCWKDLEKDGFNPKTGKAVKTLRRLHVDLELPMKEAYAEFIRARLQEAQE